MNSDLLRKTTSGRPLTERALFKNKRSHTNTVAKQHFTLGFRTDGLVKTNESVRRDILRDVGFGRFGNRSRTSAALPQTVGRRTAADRALLVFDRVGLFGLQRRRHGVCGVHDLPGTRAAAAAASVQLSHSSIGAAAYLRDGQRTASGRRGRHGPRGRTGRFARTADHNRRDSLSSRQMRSRENETGCFFFFFQIGGKKILRNLIVTTTSTALTGASDGIVIYCFRNENNKIACKQ